MVDYLKRYYELRDQINAFNYAMYVISWDSETEAPSGCFEERSKQIGVLSQLLYDIILSDEYFTIVSKLNSEELYDELLTKEIARTYKDLVKQKKVPKEKYIQLNILCSKSNNIWTMAKRNNDYSLFAPILGDIIKLIKEYTTYLETPTMKGYDVLLNEYEEGFNKAKYDVFFDQLKKEIVPLVKEVTSLPQKYTYEFTKNTFSKEKQRQFSKYIMDIMDFDQTRGMMKESEHPFTSGYCNSDVRWTNHFYENDLTSSIFSAIHELGHSIYEQQGDDKLTDTCLAGGSTMAFHESQSRFYENIIGRSKAFWETHFAKLQSIFPEELKDVSLDEFYHYVNKVEKSLIRTEADELTYPLHIMIRYEIEKMIIEQDISVFELPSLWNKLYKEYLGVDVETDKEGILQDVHWAGASFGYFPTYALGSAYGAQLFNQMKKEIDVDKAIKSGTMKDINLWLKEKVHKYGKSLTPEEILLKTTNETFNPKYYIEYLKSKYLSLMK